MTEISFARSFLSALDSRPIKLDSSHATDPRTLPSGPIYTLPPPATGAPTGTKRKRPSAASPAADAITLTLRDHKSTDPGQSSLVLPSLPRTSSVYDAKAAWAAHTGVPAQQVKLLLGRRPVADSKTLADVFGAEAKDGELVVMVLPPSRAMTDPGRTSEAAGHGLRGGGKGGGAGGEQVKEDEEEGDGKPPPLPLPDGFWTDLDEYLVGKVGAAEGARLAGVFRKAAAS